MPELLKLVTPNDARLTLFQHLPQAKPVEEWIDTANALGRTLSRAVLSPEASPAFSRSTVDGFALKAGDTVDASETLPRLLSLVGEVPMGDAPLFSVHQGEAAIIHTGGMLPEGSDAVVMLEYTHKTDTGKIEIKSPVSLTENVVLKGEDILPGQEVLPVGKCLRVADIGGLLALGITRVAVARKPRVGILSSGDEVVLPDVTPRIGQVRDINSFDLSALVEMHGGEPVRYGIVADNAEALETCIRQALVENDMVVVTAGSSVSDRDVTARVIQGLGQPGVLVHGIHIRPGKPTILAVCNGKPVIGLPGNPVSALVIAYLFAAPVVDFLCGSSPFKPQPTITARLTMKLSSPVGREEWIPVKLHTYPGGYEAEPIFFKSSLIFNLVWADGLICIPSDVNSVEVGSSVQVVPF
jgi:molybdopterin molybdotransferase